MHQDPVVIASYARTPMGGFQGALAPLKATDLGAAAVKAAVERAGVAADAVERIYMGCVLPAGLGQAPARQAALGAGLGLNTQATTVNKMCGSGMQAAIMAHEALAAGAADIIVAGGMESMTNAPYALPKHRAGARIGHDRIIDTMMMDGLEDAYEPGKAMGVFAEEAVRDYQFSRAEQDDYAIRSLSRASDAIASGAFVREITPVTVSGRGGDMLIDTDEQPGKAKPDKIPSLRPAFAKDGTITAANASSISDGAAALVMTRRSVADRLGLPVVAQVVATAAHAQEPSKFTTAPVPAMRKLLDKAGWSIEDVDLFEVNEAFASIPLAWLKHTGADPERMNVNGGAIALGHPLGASGAKLMATLVHGLRARGKRYGLQTMCEGGGVANVTIVEAL